MNIHIIKSKHVCYGPHEIAAASVAFKSYSVGISLNKWGIRIMLIWIHICLHFNLKSFLNVFNLKRRRKF